MRDLAFYLIFVACISNLNAQNKAQEYYQLKTYTFKDADQEKLTDSYLKEAFIPALHLLNINNIGVFKLRPNDTITLKKTYVLIPFSSLVQFRLLEDALTANTDYLEKGKPYLTASYKKPPYERVESIIMKAFSDMPKMAATTLKGPRKDRIYELRSYESATEAIYKNKVDMFNAGGEIKLFDRLGFNAIFYAEVLSGPKMPNLMYMTTHKNKESRQNNWKAFVESPEWKALKTVPKYQNNISHIDIDFLYPTAYSDY